MDNQFYIFINSALQRMKIVKLPNRIMFLSPTVQAGWERESCKSDFQNQAQLGKGSYGLVWKARHKKNNKIYAIKEIKKKNLSQKMIGYVRTEVKIMYLLNHPNIIKLYNHFEDELAIYFVLQFAGKGQLYKKMVKSPEKYLAQQLVARYVCQIVHALKHIHKLNIIHRDIKPENLLISQEDDIKLADFGWSNFSQGENKRDTYCGTLDYLAPQMIDRSHLHDYRVDIWSLGVLIYQLCTGKSPFSSELIKTKNLSEEAVKANIVTLNYPMSENLSDQCKDLIHKILVINPEGRISLNEILTHPWINQTSSKPQINEQVTKQKWMTKLKHEYGVIMESKEEEHKKFEAFSQDEIYNCSRLESIINCVPNQPQGGQGQKKLIDLLQLRIKQLESSNCQKEEELKYLRNIKNEHTKCGSEQNQLKETNRQLLREIESMKSQLQYYEKKINEL